jgi:hypothetical protein
MREGVGSPAQGGAARTSGNGNATPGDGRGKGGASATCQCRQTSRRERMKAKKAANDDKTSRSNTPVDGARHRCFLL